ncbi:MAG: hypothetical protein D6820_06980 [Lentisphaerae bacterium]|nr:MAG: hypothetical protein D6820_06980 [Lentisphaerota bacterium]
MSLLRSKLEKHMSQVRVLITSRGMVASIMRSQFPMDISRLSFAGIEWRIIRSLDAVMNRLDQG